MACPLYLYLGRLLPLSCCLERYAGRTRHPIFCSRCLHFMVGAKWSVNCVRWVKKQISGCRQRYIVNLDVLLHAGCLETRASKLLNFSCRPFFPSRRSVPTFVHAIGHQRFKRHMPLRRVSRLFQYGYNRTFPTVDNPPNRGRIRKQLPSFLQILFWGFYGSALSSRMKSHTRWPLLPESICRRFEFSCSSADAIDRTGSGRVYQK